MQITIIGAGRVGQAMGRAAREAGYQIGDIICRTRRSALSAVRFIGEGRAQAALRAKLSATDLIIISTPDDVIPEAVKLIRDNQSSARRAVAFHTSGALSSSALAPLAALKIAVASCHPLQSFQSPQRGLALVPESYFCIEGERRAVAAARRLVRAMGARHFEIPTEMKSLYHALAVMASGGVTALVSISLEMLESCGLSRVKSQRVLLPLVEGTIKNIRAVGPERSLTGPVSRGDAGTIERNLKAIAEVNSDWLEIYRLLAAQSVTLAERIGVDHRALNKMRRLLKRA